MYSAGERPLLVFKKLHFFFGLSVSIKEVIKTDKASRLLGGEICAILREGKGSGTDWAVVSCEVERARCLGKKHWLDLSVGSFLRRSPVDTSEICFILRKTRFSERTFSSFCPDRRMLARINSSAKPAVCI